MIRRVFFLPSSAAYKLRPSPGVKCMSTLLTKEEEPSLLREETEDGLVVLTLNRPRKRNALSFELLQRLENEFDAIAASKAIKCLVLQASGEAVFSSGHDLTELKRADTTHIREIFETCSRMMIKLAELPQPSISMVKGVCTAAGLQLALTCDFVIADEKATFSTPGVDIGLFCSTPSVALVRTGGNDRLIKDMLFTGRRISAQEAFAGGLISRVSMNAEREAQTLARQIMSKSNSALRLGKKILREHAECSTISDSYRIATEGMIKNMTTMDSCEGINAFLEKRPPKWKND